MSHPIKLTLDTNCIINLFDSQAETPTSVEVLNELMRLGLSNKVEIKITTRVEADLSKDPLLDRKKEMLKILNMFPVIGTVFRLDISRLGGGDMLSGEESPTTEIQRILFPGLSSADKRYFNKLNDVDHLAGHFMNSRDIFVTDDTNFLKKHEGLKSSLGIVVMRPDECLTYVEKIIDRATPRSLDPKEIDKKYQSKSLSGKVTFDYSNNNGRFVIGEGHFLFETRWSSASDISIHAYTDSPSIQSLALFKEDKPIKGIGDVSGLDYTSRVRSPNEGQIVIWRNVNGIYAATKVIDVKSDSRSDDRDELTFEYLIQIDGSAIL